MAVANGTQFASIKSPTLYDTNRIPTAPAHTGSAGVLVDYQAEDLPLDICEWVSNGPIEETSEHFVFVEDGILHMMDGALYIGNSLGCIRHLPFEPTDLITVEFRARVLSGQS